MVDELLLLRKHWERMCKLEEAYGDVLTTHTADLEKGMDPDVWRKTIYPPPPPTPRPIDGEREWRLTVLLFLEPGSPISRESET